MLQGLREEKGISQRTLSEKCGISRGRLRRLEGKDFGRATYQEMKLLAGVLGVEVAAFFQNGEMANGEMAKKEVYMAKASETGVQIGSQKSAYRLVSYLPFRARVFAGKLAVAAGRQCTLREVFGEGMIFLQVILGMLKVHLRGECYEIQEGDTFVFPADAPYEIANPLLRDALSFLIVPKNK